MSNPNTFLSRQAKQAQKFQIVLVFPQQILKKYCISKQSKLKITNSTCTQWNPDILLCKQAKQAQNFQHPIVQVIVARYKISNSTYFTLSNPNISLCKRAKRAQKFQIGLVIPSKILIYYCVSKQSKPKNFK